MKNCTILNADSSAWAFQELAEQLSKVLWIPISETPAEYNYVLSWDEKKIQLCQPMFISFEAIKLASDKRLLAFNFIKNKLPIPDTYLFQNSNDVLNFLRNNYQKEWCLKYPLGCGGSGHQIVDRYTEIPEDYPKPYILQRFIRQENPQVFRLYCAGGNIFGWNVRKFPQETITQPWVAHSRGAVYEVLGEPPIDAVRLAEKTFRAVNLYDSFGCIDLIQDSDRNWLVLEVGTDGIFNHVDRQIGDRDLETEIDRRLAETFWSFSTAKPWGNFEWHPQRLS
jgi:glutathione synthase/RimK-type ligase-like ATP-grasp enzyme